LTLAFAALLAAGAAVFLAAGAAPTRLAMGPPRCKMGARPGPRTPRVARIRNVQSSDKPATRIYWRCQSVMAQSTCRVQRTSVQVCPAY
jgi:hypothetical protein